MIDMLLGFAILLKEYLLPNIVDIQDCIMGQTHLLRDNLVSFIICAAAFLFVVRYSGQIWFGTKEEAATLKRQTRAIALWQLVHQMKIDDAEQ